jgi:hypothetical protein
MTAVKDKRKTLRRRATWFYPRFEHHREPLLPRAAFLLRLVRYICVALVIALAALAIGVIGYHGFEGLPWIDATLNAAMILGGMGPVQTLHTFAGKLFASVYALFSGLIFLVIVGLLFAPVIHRFFHRFHLQLEDKNSDS